MSHHATKSMHQIKVILAGLAGRTDQALCADQDGWAQRLGWTVTRTGFGARRYRDPRFDGRAAQRTAVGTAPAAPSSNAASSPRARSTEPPAPATEPAAPVPGPSSAPLRRPLPAGVTRRREWA